MKFLLKPIKWLISLPVRGVKRFIKSKIKNYILGSVVALAFTYFASIPIIQYERDQFNSAIQQVLSEDISAEKGFLHNLTYSTAKVLNKYFNIGGNTNKGLDTAENTANTVNDTIEGVANGSVSITDNVSAPNVSLTIAEGSTWSEKVGSLVDKIKSAYGGSVNQEGAVAMAGNSILETTALDYFLNLPTDKTNFNFDYYEVVGVSGINPDEFPEKGKIELSSLDELGRSGTARGSLTFENVKGSYGVRQEFTSKSVPSGWKTQKKGDEKVIYWQNPQTGEEKPYRGYFWNKSHQIADSLGGTTDRENLVTGTRTQNVGGSNNLGGMRYSERKAQKFLEDNQSAVLYYEVQPIYQGNELIPRGSVVRMKSSDGSIDEKILVPNHAYGWEIDYMTGFIKQVVTE